MSTEPKPVIVLGAGGHARVLVAALRALEIPILGFVAPPQERVALPGCEWLGSDDVLSRHRAADLVNGIGSAGRARRRAELYDEASGMGRRFRTIVHPGARVDPSAVLAEGAQVLVGAIVAAGAVVSENAIVNSGAILEHDVVLGRHSHLATGAMTAGGVTIGTAVHVGLGARVIQGVTIGDGAVVGAGAVVLEDVPDGIVVAGVPARRIDGGGV